MKRFDMMDPKQKKINRFQAIFSDFFFLNNDPKYHFIENRIDVLQFSYSSK